MNKKEREIETKCQFHQRFSSVFFLTIVVSAAFFYLHVHYMYAEKAAKTTFVQNARITLMKLTERDKEEHRD